MIKINWNLITIEFALAKLKKIIYSYDTIFNKFLKDLFITQSLPYLSFRDKTSLIQQHINILAFRKLLIVSIHSVYVRSLISIDIK